VTSRRQQSKSAYSNRQIAMRSSQWRCGVSARPALTGTPVRQGHDAPSREKPDDDANQRSQEEAVAMPRQ
jgi:hypothetical protein